MLETHRKHWTKRWKAEHLDSYLGGRGIGRENLTAAKLVADRLKAESVLELGPGSWRFARVCIEHGVKNFVGMESKIGEERSLTLKPDQALSIYVDDFSRIDFPNKSFDVVYQCNTVPNLLATQIRPCLLEVARVGKLFVWAGDLRCRFWDLPRVTMRERRSWMRAMLSELFEDVEHVGDSLFDIQVLKPR